VLVYIAGPYAQGDVAVNVRNAIDAAEQVWQAGHTPFVPHLNVLWHMVYPHPPSDWYFWDSIWLMRCDALIRLEGESPGADMEVQQACRERTLVYYGVEAFLLEHGARRRGLGDEGVLSFLPGQIILCGPGAGVVGS